MMESTYDFVSLNGMMTNLRGMRISDPDKALAIARSRVPKPIMSEPRTVQHTFQVRLMLPMWLSWTSLRTYIPWIIVIVLLISILVTQLR